MPIPRFNISVESEAFKLLSAVRRGFGDHLHSWREEIDAKSGTVTIYHPGKSPMSVFGSLNADVFMRADVPIDSWKMVHRHFTDQEWQPYEEGCLDHLAFGKWSIDCGWQCKTPLFTDEQKSAAHTLLSKVPSGPEDIRRIENEEPSSEQLKPPGFVRKIMD